jgi:tRNA-binding EMAP/Myf-like protein
MDTISFDDFRKVDIRIGTVIKAEVPSWSHWVIKLTVDFASEAKSAKDRTSRRVRIEPRSQEGRSGGETEIGEKVCFSGIMKFFSPEVLLGKQFPFVVNLEPKKIGPEKDFSEAMMIMACPQPSERSDGRRACPGGDDNDVAPVLFKLQKKVPNGTKVF